MTLAFYPGSLPVISLLMCLLFVSSVVVNKILFFFTPRPPTGCTSIYESDSERNITVFSQKCQCVLSEQSQ